jgi:hypothetical protein
MRKTKVNKRKFKYSKKPRRTRKNNRLCEKGITDEVLIIKRLIKQLQNKNNLTTSRTKPT